ncbi:MAG TPA: hypothetical protein VF230_09860 [Acidimicrobiales bacterium]
MASTRRIGALLTGALLTAVVGGSAATAQAAKNTPEAYAGSAAGQALLLKVGPDQYSAGATSASADSTLKAAAGASGMADVPVLGGDKQEAAVAGEGESDGSAEQVCGGSIEDNPLEGVLDLGTGCAAALAEVKGGSPHALGTAKVAGLDVDLPVLTSEHVTVEDLAAVLDPVLGAVGTVQDALETNTGQAVPLTETLSQLTTALLETKTLGVTVGDSKSEVTTAPGAVTAFSRSEAGTLELFPFGASLETATGVEVKPIVEVVVGSAEAKATFDRKTGKSTGTFDPAIVTIRVNTPLIDEHGKILDFDLSEIVIGPDLQPSALPAEVNDVIAEVVTPCTDAPNEFCILEGSPIETRITIASGRTTNNPDGSVTAVSDAVKIHALKNIGDLPGVAGTPLDGGLVLNLAHAEAAVGGKLAESVAAPPAAPPAAPGELPRGPEELPRTGGIPWLPLAAIAGAALAIGLRSTVRRANAS